MFHINRVVKAVLAAVAIVMLASLAVSCTQESETPDDMAAKWREIWSADVTLEADGSTVFSFADPGSMKKLAAGTYEYALKNTDSRAVTVHIVEDGKVSDISVGVGVTFALGKITSDIPLSSCIGITVDGRTAYFVSDITMLDYAVRLGSAEAVIMTDDMKTDGDFVVSAPVKLITDSYKLTVEGRFGIVTDSEGKVEIWNSSAKDITCDGFFAEAPNADITVNKPFLDLGGNEAFYLSAKSYNGTPILADVKLVKNRAMLDDLTDESKYPILYKDMTVRIADCFVLEGDDAVFKEPVTLIFDGTFWNDGAKFVFDTDTAGTISVKNIGSSKIDRSVFSFDAPSCDLVTYECDITLFDLLSESALYSFRGVKLSDCKLGGDGIERLIGLKMTADGNRGLASDVAWTVYGDYAYATVSCVVDPERLRHASLTAQTSGGTVSFESGTDDGTVDLLSDTGCFCTVTDADGKTHRYAVMIEYIPTKLPVVVIDVDGDEAVDSLEEYKRATIRIECGSLDGEYPSLAETAVNIRGRGNSTWEWEKKPFKLKFDSKTSVLGMTANKSWTLLANYADKSLIRNHVALVMAHTLDNMPFATSQYPVDVFLNGEYIGVYTLGEQIQVKKGRVDIDVSDDTNVLDTGYLLQIGGTTSADTWDVTCFRTSLLRYVKIESPSDEILTRARVSYIKQYCLDADEAVKAGEGYDEYIDVDSLIDWCILHELAFNLDSCFHRSVFMFKEAGGKLTMGPAWDFDLALGNMSRDYNKYDIWLIPGKNDEEAYIKLNWLNYLYTNESFCRRMEARWNEIKDELLENALSAVDEMGEKVTPSAADNFKVWDILGKKVAFEPSYTNQYDTYEKQLKYLRDFIENRWKWIDANVGKLPLTPADTDILPKPTATATATAEK